MIIYYDSGCRHFTDIFAENGQICVQHYRHMFPGRVGGYICSRKWLKPMSRILPDVSADDPLIIVFDTATTASYIKKLKRKYPNKHIIFWCWNRISEDKIDEIEQIKRMVDVWSYSLDDCRRFDLKYNTQFFFDSLIPETDPENGNNGNGHSRPKALFIGREKKARDKILKKAFAELEAEGTEVETYISRGRSGRYKYSLREKLIPYKDVIKRARDADILIDCYGTEKAGCSLRAMEAIFLGKKLITDNLALADYDFYDSHNIYFIDKEDRSLKDFLAEPGVAVDREICDRYRFSSWIERFLQDE